MSAPGTDNINRLDRLLRPKSIAIFGGKEAAQTIKQCQQMQYPYAIWPVHPTREEIAGIPCYRSVEELPGAPDASFIGVNRHLTVGIVEALSARGAGGAICYASGYKEADAEMKDGSALQQQLVDAAGAMPILGPNCYGFINYLDGALLWPDQHGGQRENKGVAILTQSSNIAINLSMQKRGLPISYILTAGNQAQTGLSALASGVMDDPRVTALGFHIEGIDDVAAFEATLLKARKKNIPVVILKMGKSEAAQQLALSHTASLSGSDSLADAFFQRLGAARVQSIAELLESLKLLHVHGPLSDSRVCSMSCSGGEASLMADSAESRKVNFPALTESQSQAVKATLSQMVNVANPLDYHTFIWSDETRLTATFSAMASCGFDLSMVILDLPRSDRCEVDTWTTTLGAVKATANNTSAPMAVVSSMPENMPEDSARELTLAGIAPMMGIDETLAAIEAAAFIGRSYASTPPDSLSLLGCERNTPEHQNAETGIMDEARSKSQISQYGVSTPDSRVVDTPDEAAQASKEIGFPVVLKAVGEHLLHKTELGAVHLNLNSTEAVYDAACSMQHLQGQFMVEPMINDTVAELILGINTDPQFGLYMIIGAGGILVELMNDCRTLLLPTTAEAISEAILSLHYAPLLHGFRNRPKADIAAATDAALALARFAEANADSLLEVDINPLMLGPEGRGAIAADALIRTRINH